MTLYLLSLLGVMVFAISGALEASKNKFDLMGVLVIAVVTAIGGGTIRDVLLGQYPISWVNDPNYLSVALLTGAMIFLLSRYYQVNTKTILIKIILIADALGLALFSISGTQLALQAMTSDLIAVIMGTITGAAGGVIRDVLCSEVPVLLRAKETLYATAAICGSSLYIVLVRFGVGETSAALIGMAVVALMRLMAIIWRISLPSYRDPI